MNPDKTAALQAAPQEDTDLNAPSARPQTALVPQQEENVPAVTPNRTDSAPDSAAYPELKMPEDVSFPEGALEEFKTLSQEMGLSAEQVQKLLDLEARYARSGEQHRAAEKSQTLERWIEQTKALYGARLEETVSLAVRAADAFGGHELRELLEATGLGNHPVIVRTFYEIGKSISEDVLPGGKPAAPQDKTFAEALYGKNN